jgi:hypothetical protein
MLGAVAGIEGRDERQRDKLAADVVALRDPQHAVVLTQRAPLLVRLGVRSAVNGRVVCNDFD